MSRHPELDQLLAPLMEPVDALASRRLHVDKDKVVERMVQASLQPPRRFGLAPRVVAGVALAAALALAVWGGTHAWPSAKSAGFGAVEVQAQRGAVLTTSGRLSAGTTTSLRAEGTLETPPGAEARLKTTAGLDIELLESTRVSLAELGNAALRLERGRVRCVVTHDPSRTFAVVTADARIVDVGTTFSVRVEPVAGASFTFVHVEEGEVRVEHAGRAELLRAGQSWSSQPPPPEPGVGGGGAARRERPERRGAAVRRPPRRAPARAAQASRRHAFARDAAAAHGARGRASRRLGRRPAGVRDAGPAVSRVAARAGRGRRAGPREGAPRPPLVTRATWLWLLCLLPSCDNDVSLQLLREEPPPPEPCVDGEPCSGLAPALSFRAAYDRVEIESSPLLDVPQDFTLEAWVLVRSYDGGHGVINRWVSGLGDLQLTFGTPEPLPALQLPSDAPVPSHVLASWAFVRPDYWVTARAPSLPSTGAWHHLASCYGGGSFRLYVDGELAGSVAGTDPVPNPQSPLYLGATARYERPFDGATGTLYWPPIDGFIADVRLSRRARYDADFTPETRLEADAATLALWHLDEGDGRSVHDSGPRDLGGIVHGATWELAPRRDSPPTEE